MNISGLQHRPDNEGGKESMFCPNCGSKIDDDSIFCEECGARVSFEEPVRESRSRGKNSGRGRSSGGRKPRKRHYAGKFILTFLAVFLVAVLIIGGINLVLYMKVKNYTQDVKESFWESFGIENREKTESQEELVEELADEVDDLVKEDSEEQNDTPISEEDTWEEEEVEPVVEMEKENPTSVPSETPQPENVIVQASVVTDQAEVTALKTGTMLPQTSVTGSTASSMIKQTKNDNLPIYLFDNDPSTSWQEGVSGPGIGEYVQYIFDKEYTVTALTFRLGNWKDERYFYGNNRPKTLKIETDRNVWVVTFPDSWTEFGVKFSSPVKCKEMKIRVEEVYSGSQWDDTPISDMGVWCTKTTS